MGLQFHKDNEKGQWEYHQICGHCKSADLVAADAENFEWGVCFSYECCNCGHENTDVIYTKDSLPTLKETHERQIA